MRLVIVVGFLVSVRVLQASEPVYSFLDATADAISTALGAIESGEMQIEYHMVLSVPRELEPYREDEELTGTVVWQGESLYADFLLASTTTMDVGSENERVVQSGDAGPSEIIQTPDVFCWYQKDKNWCRHQTVNPLRALNVRYLAAFRPRVNWFSTTQNPTFNHVRYGLTSRTDEPEDDLTTVTSVEGFPRRRKIERGIKARGLTSGYIVDLDKGGMVIEGWARPPQADWYATTWDWKQDQHGVWYVSHWKHTVTDKDDHDQVNLLVEVTVKNFNSQPKIPANRFQFSSLKLAPGTRVEHVTAGGKSFTHVGGKPREQKKFELDSLIDDVQDGFAGPKQGKP